MKRKSDTKLPKKFSSPSSWQRHKMQEEMTKEQVISSYDKKLQIAGILCSVCLVLLYVGIVAGMSVFTYKVADLNNELSETKSNLKLTYGAALCSENGLGNYGNSYDKNCMLFIECKDGNLRYEYTNCDAVEG